MPEEPALVHHGDVGSGVRASRDVCGTPAPFRWRELVCPASLADEAELRRDKEPSAASELTEPTSGVVDVEAVVAARDGGEVMDLDAVGEEPAVHA